MITGLTENLPDYVERPALPGPAGREGYGRIDFEVLPNTRDLGELIGADGRRVKPGLLLRSGALGFASDGDLARLRDDYHLSLIVDLRNDIELSELPDPVRYFPGVRYMHANILPEEAAGITQERATKATVAMQKAQASQNPDAFMEAFYPFILAGPGGLEGYQQFFEALLACEEGAALWHCSVGRDRCGMASMLVEWVLGVSWDQIEGDYLATNLFAPLEYSIDFAARMAALNSAVRFLKREYGGIDGYLKQALGVTEDDRATLRNRYLEK